MIGCSKSNDSEIKESVDTFISDIKDYDLKKIGYFHANNVVIDNQKQFNDVYIVKIYSQHSSNDDILLILNNQFEIVQTSTYTTDKENKLNYVYELPMTIDNQSIDDSMFTDTIE